MDFRFGLPKKTTRCFMLITNSKNDLEYMDDQAERLGRQKMRSDAMKRQFAINGSLMNSQYRIIIDLPTDYKRTQKVLATCPFCFGEDDSPPKAPVVSMGSRAYLSCTTQEELVPGHCLIVPIQHHLTMLEADDDVWDEIRVYHLIRMKSLNTNYITEFYEESDADVR
jgi:hypothetical protein